MAAKRSFGQIQKLPSKRYRARYTGPDVALHNAPHTFEARLDAEAWLTDERRLIVAGTWTPPAGRGSPLLRATQLGDYAESWLTRRDLKPTTRHLYRQLLDKHILPSLGNVPLTAITPRLVADWHHALTPKHKTRRAHSYALLRTILGSAVIEREIPFNPCQVRAGGVTKRSIKIEPATIAQLEAIAAAMPKRYQPLVMLASWCGLRFGETAELRRKDLDLRAGVVHIRRGVTRAGAEVVVGSPKSEAGVRDVAIPPHLLPMLREHLESMPMRGRDALVFPAADGVSHLAPTTLYRVYYRAREYAGRPDLRWHDLRHTGAVLAAQTGATLAELMARLGHSTPSAALRYQHAAKGRDQEIAAALSVLSGKANPVTESL
jgi:integrase